jgi:hypothetical protein
MVIRAIIEWDLIKQVNRKQLGSRACNRVAQIVKEGHKRRFHPVPIK